MSNKLDLCVRAYLEYYRSQFKKYGWASDYAEQLIQTDQKASLEFVVELLNICKNEEEIVFVASGALEDFLERYILTHRKEIEKSILEHPKMRVAIRYVWSEEKTLLQMFLREIELKFNLQNNGTEVGFLKDGSNKRSLEE